MSDASKKQDNDTGTEIERAKQELEDMIDVSEQIVLLVDRKLNIIRANKPALNFIGKNRFSEILNKNINDLIYFDHKLISSDLINTTPAIGYKTFNKEVKIFGKEKRQLHISVIASKKNPDSIILMISDITKDIQSAIDEEKKHKKEAVRLLGGALMHIINQPLTVIVMRAQMLKLAFEKGKLDKEEVNLALHDISKLSLEISGILQNLDHPKDFVTEDYVDGVKILDLHKSGIKQKEITSFQIIDSLLAAIENRTAGFIDHSRHTAAIADIIAARLDLSASLASIVHHSALIHDIGKIAIPDAIITKSTPLTHEESAIIKKHVEFGYKILKSMMFFDYEADAVLSHHEYFDGTGHPNGLSGDKIPIAAKIVAIADALDVMLCGRHYCKAISPEEAVEKLKKSSGKQFDPDIIKITIENISEISKVLNLHKK